MKKVVLIAVSSFLGITGTIFGQKIYGSGKVVTESRPVKNFTVLDLDGIFEVEILQADSNGVKVEADDNLLPHIKIENVDNTLKVYDDDEDKIKKFTKFKVYIYVKNITKLMANMYGKVEVKNAIKADTFQLIAVSEADISLAVDCNVIVTDLNSNGNTNLSGSAKRGEIVIKGVGNLNAYNLKLETAKITTSAPGGVEINISKEVIVYSSGTGFVHIKGDAIILKKDVSGLGTVKKVK